MPYSPTSWVEGVTKLGPTNMNKIEQGLETATSLAEAAVTPADTPATNEVLMWSGSALTYQKVVNAMIDAAAAIAYSKLALTGAIVNSDVNANAAIALSKLAITGTPNGAKFLRDDGSWQTPGASASLSSDSSALASNLTLTSQNTFYTHANLTLSLAAGTWLVSGQVCCVPSSGGDNFTAKIWDGSTNFASAWGRAGNSNDVITLTLAPIPVSPGAPTDYKISVACNGGSSRVVRAAAGNNAAGNTASYISAVQIG